MRFKIPVAVRILQDWHSADRLKDATKGEASVNCFFLLAGDTSRNGKCVSRFRVLKMKGSLCLGVEANDHLTIFYC